MTSCTLSDEPCGYPACYRNLTHSASTETPLRREGMTFLAFLAYRPEPAIALMEESLASGLLQDAGVERQPIHEQFAALIIPLTKVQSLRSAEEYIASIAPAYLRLVTFGGQTSLDADASDIRKDAKGFWIDRAHDSGWVPDEVIEQLSGVIESSSAFLAQRRRMCIWAGLLPAIEAQRLRPGDWGVLRTLAMHADGRGMASASVKTLAGESHYNPRTVTRHLHQLSEKGYLHITPPLRTQGQTSNLYTFPNWLLALAERLGSEAWEIVISREQDLLSVATTIEYSIVRAEAALTGIAALLTFGSSSTTPESLQILVELADRWLIEVEDTFLGFEEYGRTSAHEWREIRKYLCAAYMARKSIKRDQERVAHRSEVYGDL